jgi:hypothetical protein
MNGKNRIAADPDIKMTPIGCIELGIDGKDQYVLLERRDANLSPKQAIEWLLPQVYQETRQEAGGYFCKTVHAVREQYRKNACICTIQHRYDV